MSVSRQIEMKKGKSRLFEDFRLEGCDPGRVREVGVVETAYDSILAHDLTYVSTPITSGALLYKVLADTGVKTLEELRDDKAFFFENVIKPNIENADKAAQRILDLKGGAIIAPAAFEAKQLGWGQDEYMGMWFDVIEKKATRIVLLDGWEYSNGAGEEYLQAILMQAGRRDRDNIEVVDERGDKIMMPQAVRLIGDAIEDLMNRNFEPKTSAIVLNRLLKLYDITVWESNKGQAAEPSAQGKTGGGTGTSIEYCQSAVSPEEMKHAHLDVLKVLDEARKMIPHHEYNMTTFEMAPSLDDKNKGLVRSEEREDLAGQPAKILKPEEAQDKKKKPGKKNKGPKPKGLS